jgi:hypothetical protein
MNLMHGVCLIAQHTTLAVGVLFMGFGRWMEVD